MEKNKSHITPYVTVGGLLAFRCNHTDEKNTIEIPNPRLSIEGEEDEIRTIKMESKVCPKCAEKIVKVFNDLLNNNK